MAVILGIDPGLATVGFGVIETSEDAVSFIDCGIIKTTPKLPFAERLKIIKDDIDNLLEEFNPDAVGIEELFFAKNVTNAIKVSHARGVIVEAVHRKGIPIYDFTPLQVKNNITGYGAADKLAVQKMVKQLLVLDKIPKPDDAADGLAIAICAARVA